MNLKYMKASLFEITYKKKWTFSRHSNLLRCTCINEYCSYVQIYTDASKSLDNKIGVAFTVPEFHIGKEKDQWWVICLYRGNDCTIISNTVDRRDKTFEISYLFRFMCIIG